MSTICKNCATPLHGNFCNKFGQPADTHKLNLHFLWHDIQHGLFHFDKGIPYTVKELFTRPGNSIREFIEGKRVKHYKPISLIIVLAALYGVLWHYFHIEFPHESTALVTNIPGQPNTNNEDEFVVHPVV